MFGQSLGESVVSVFVYIGIGSFVVLGCVISMFLLDEVLHRKPKHIASNG